MSKSPATSATLPPWMQPTISADVAKKIAELRQKFPNIPADLNTNFSLRRWILDSGTVDETKRELDAYIRNRRAAGFDNQERIEQWKTAAVCQKLLKYFAISIKVDNFDTKTNSIVVVAKIEGSNYKKLVDVASSFEFVSITFLACETISQEVLRRESATGRPCGVSILVDMSGLMRYFKDCLNPFSTMNLYFSCASTIVQYYPRLLSRIISINGSFLATAVSKMKIVKDLFEHQLHAAFLLVDRKELLQIFNAECIPKSYGGTLRETAAIPGLDVDIDGCVIRPSSLDGVGFAPLWMPTMQEKTSRDIPPKHTQRVVRRLSGPNYRLQWWVHTSSEIIFSLYYTKVYSDNEDRSTWTRLQMHCPIVTVNVDESGEHICQGTGEGNYILEFENVHPSQRVLLVYGVRKIPL